MVHHQPLVTHESAVDMSSLFKELTASSAVNMSSLFSDSTASSYCYILLQYTVIMSPNVYLCLDTISIQIFVSYRCGLTGLKLTD